MLYGTQQTHCFCRVYATAQRNISIQVYVNQHGLVHFLVAALFTNLSVGTTSSLSYILVFDVLRDKVCAALHCREPDHVTLTHSHTQDYKRVYKLIAL